MVDRLTEFENRLTAMEKSHGELASGFDTFKIECNGKLQTLTDAFDTFKDDISDKLDSIIIFVTGANTVFGLARRHWKRILVFGAGFMTAAGVGNPKVNAFIASFMAG